MIIIKRNRLLKGLSGIKYQVYQKLLAYDWLAEQVETDSEWWINECWLVTGTDKNAKN